MENNRVVFFWIFGATFVFSAIAAPLQPLSTNWWDTNAEIQILQEYLRIPSVHPNPDYEPCVEFLRRQATALNLPINVFTPVQGKPVVLISWQGSAPDLPSILLNSHMDVVPAFENSWTYPPFEAIIDQEGKIFARGTQDTKSLGLIYLAAIRELQAQGFQPKRTVHVLYVPDEEIGGIDGMKAFVQTQDFKNLNVDFALDEGAISGTDVYNLFYGEKTSWKVKFIARGQTGHGSLLLDNTAAEGFSAILSRLMEYRKAQVLREKSGTPRGNLTSINLTILSGGVMNNVIPEELSATFDVRVAPEDDEEALIGQFNQWITEAGGQLEMVFEQRNLKAPPSIPDNSNPLWTSFQNAMSELNMEILSQILPGATDSRYLRMEGIPAFSFLPMNGTPLLAHENDEFIYADQYIKGIGIYAKIIERLTVN